MKATSVIPILPSNSHLGFLTSFAVVAVVGAYFGVQFVRKHTEPVADVAFAPDGKSVASAGTDGVVLIWDVFTGMARTQPGKSEAVFSVAYSPDGKTLASETWNDQRPDDQQSIIEFRDSVSGKLLAAVYEHSWQGDALRYSPDGSLLVLAGNEVMVWDVAAARPRVILKGGARCITFSPDGKTLAIGSGDRTIKLWDVDNGKERAILKGNKSSAESICFSPDGKFLVSASNETFLANPADDPPGEVKIWDVASGLVKSEFSGASPVRAVAFSPDGVTLALGEANGTVQV
jgi:WD40 repeat protein